MAWEKNSNDEWVYKNADGSTMQSGYAQDSHGMARVENGVWDGTYAKEINDEPEAKIQVYDPTADIEAMSAAQKKAALAGLEKSYNQSVSDLDAARGKIEPTYYEQRNNVSTDAQLASKNFAEYLASRGQNNASGMVGTNAQSKIADNVALQGNLGSLAKGEAGAYAQNAKDLSDLQTAYNSDRASTEAGIEASAMQSLINAQQQYNANLLAQANADRNYNYQVGRDYVTDTGYTKSGAQTLAGQQAQSAITGQNLANDYQKLVNAGYPEAQALELAYKRAQIANTNKSTSLMGVKSSSGGGSDGGGAAQTWSNLIYGQKSNTDALTVLRQKKSSIINDLIQDGMTGNAALNYWKNMESDLTGE